MGITELFAGVPVADLGPAIAWYARLLGRAADLVPNDSEAAWRLGDGTGWIYVVADPDRAGNALLTVLVDDLDAHVAELTDRGIAVGPIETIPAAVRKAVVTDPAGNMITFGEPLGPGG